MCNTITKILYTLWYHLVQVVQHSIQPPVIASILGMIISFITPLRRLFVVTTLTSSQQQQPPLFSWFFDGLYEIGQAAVPINMIILGINISTSFFDTKKKYEGQEEQKKFVINQNHQHHPKKEEECILLFTPQHYMFESKTPTPLSSTAITLAVLGMYMDGNKSLSCKEEEKKEAFLIDEK